MYSMDGIIYSSSKNTCTLTSRVLVVAIMRVLVVVPLRLLLIMHAVIHIIDVIVIKQRRRMHRNRKGKERLMWHPHISHWIL